MSRSRFLSIALPPLVAHVASAAEAERQRSNRLAGNHAAALRELSALMALALPARGVLAPDDELCDAIDRVAARHLERAPAEAQFRAAIARINDLKQRDAVESAHDQLVWISEQAHYYAGLAAGITLASLNQDAWTASATGDGRDRRGW
jgi:hypothetical protein